MWERTASYARSGSSGLTLGEEGPDEAIGVARVGHAGRSLEIDERAGVRLEARPQRRRRVVQSGLRGPEWDVESVGHLVQGQIEVVMEDEDGALLERQPPEGALELVAVVDAQNLVGVVRPSTGRMRISPDQRRRRRASA